MGGTELKGTTKAFKGKQKTGDSLTGGQQSNLRFRNFGLTFFILFAFWVLLSGKFDSFHITLGIICSILIAYLSHDLLFFDIKLGNLITRTIRFIKAAPWFIWQIISANLHVAYLALSPKMPINPQIISFKTKLESELSYVAMANSITLTPGTITVDIKDGEFFVHALSQKVADDLNTGEMEDKIAYVFMEAGHV